MSGYGGAGTFSDGKLNFIPKLGKSDLFKYMSQSEAYEFRDSFPKTLVGKVAYRQLEEEEKNKKTEE